MAVSLGPGGLVLDGVTIPNNTTDSVIQMKQSTANSQLSGTIGGSATPAYNVGTSFHTFSFTPKSASSALFLWSSNISIYETSNHNDVFYAAAFYDQSTICINYTPVRYSSFNGSLNATFISVMGRTSSWGTATKTIDIRVGSGNTGGQHCQVNWDIDYYSQHLNSPSGSAIQFFMMEVAQ